MMVARWRCTGGQEAVLAARRLGRVEAADHPHGRVGHDAPFDLAGRLLGADEDHPQRAPTLGHVEQDLLDGARALAGRVLVELVEHHELQRPGLPGALFALERPLEHDPDHEPLGPVVEVVEVDDRHLCPVEVDAVPLGPGHVAAHEVAQVRPGAVQPAQEGVDGARADGPPGPLIGAVGIDLELDQLDQIVEAAHDLAVDVDPTVAHRLGVAQPRRHVVDHHRVLLAVVLGIGEQERQQLVAAELLDGPEERGDVALAGGDVGAGVGVAAHRRGEAGDRAERPGRQPQPGVAGRLIVAQPRVGVVEEEQVLALDVEDERLGVGGLGAQHPGVEQAVEQEGGVAGLGGHARDAADVDVGAAAAVDELEVEVEGLVVAGQTGGRAGPASARTTAPRRARRPPPCAPPRPAAAGRTPRARTGWPRTWAASLTSAGRTPSATRNTSLSKRAPSWRARTCDTTPEMLSRWPSGKQAVDHHDVVELQVGAVAHPHPELQAASPARCR